MIHQISVNFLFKFFYYFNVGQLFQGTWVIIGLEKDFHTSRTLKIDEICGTIRIFLSVIIKFQKKISKFC